MKKIFYILLFVLGTCAFHQCAKDPVDLTGSISGTVTDSETNEPIKGANIVLSPTGVSSVTGANGGFEFHDLEAQQYNVAVTASGYTYNNYQVIVTAGQNTSCDVNLTAEEQTTGFLLSPESLLFGSNFTELTFTISNTGNTSSTSWSISGIDADWLTVSPSTGVTSVGESSVVKVSVNRSSITSDQVAYFIVNAGGGSKQILVTVSHVAELPSIDVSPTSLDFGETSTTKYFTVKNDGSADLTFEFLGVEDWFSATCSTYTLTAGESTSVGVTIDRDKLTESKSHELIVSSNAGNKAVELNATYVAKYAELSVTPVSLDFGETSSVDYVIVKNNGTADLTFEFLGVEDWFSATCSKYTLAAGESTTVTVSIDRSKFSTSASGALIISSNAGNTTVSLSASEYIPTPNLALYVSEVDFGESLIYQTFTVYNTGDAAMTFSVNENLNWLSASYTGSVAAGSSTVVTLTLDRDEVYGQVSEDISIVSDGGSTSLTVKAYEPIDYGTVSSCDRDIDISVTGVEVSGTTAYIDFKMINNGSETHLQFRVGQPYSGTMYSIDDKSNTYSYDNKNMSITVNDKTISYYLGYSNYGYVQNTFIGNGASLIGTIMVTGLDSSASEFTTISVGTYAYSSTNQLDETSFKLYNVPIIR